MKKRGEKLRAKITEAPQSHTEGILGKDPREARGGERKEKDAYLLLIVSEEACLELSHSEEYTQDLSTET